MVPVKQVIVVRKDLKMSKGKMAAQVAHASLGALFMAMGIGKFAPKHEGETIQIRIPYNSPLHYWLNKSFTKVVLEIEDKQAMAILQSQLMMQDRVPYSIIVDEGRTEFEGETLTCIGIGPFWSEPIDEFTGHLKLYKDEQADFYLKRRIAELEKQLSESIFIPE